jgi:pantoate--beta-alanine ligase
MKIVSDPRKMQAHCRALKCKGRTLGFVPTMGALHEGHLSLIRRSKEENDITCVSIFVNPIQFGPAEDLACYPRPIRRDTSLCKKENVDLLFVPAPRALYGRDFRTHVEVRGLSDVLCGAVRQGHFRGVATVVAKLFNIAQPDRAYFGRKDFQQAVIVRRMAEELNFPVKIRVMPTIREADGLAMSSRNTYLGAEDRKEAVVLAKSLRLARTMARAGTRDPREIIRRMTRMIGSRKRAKLEYIEVIDPETLAPLKRIEGVFAVVLAARVGATRLIDNSVITP